MDATEQFLWKQHQERLAQIERQAHNLRNKYDNDRAAYEAGYGGKENIPDDVKRRLDEKFSRDMQAINLRRQRETNRVQDDFVKNDQRKEQIKKQQLEEKRQQEFKDKQSKQSEYAKRTGQGKDLYEQKAESELKEKEIAAKEDPKKVTEQAMKDNQKRLEKEENDRRVEEIMKQWEKQREKEKDRTR